MFCVYVIQNQQEKKYIGQTQDLAKRLLRHNQVLPTKKTSFTHKNKQDWKLVYMERYNTRKEALIREKQLKSFQGRKFIKGILLGR